MSLTLFIFLSMETATVVIPIYKSTLSRGEVVSIHQTMKVVGHHGITFVCPEGLDISVYLAIGEEEGITPSFLYFSPLFFKDISGYNRLLLTESFYQSFSNYEYILICQPDAYVFKDELIDWCKKGYDYIGAPIIGDSEDTFFSMKMRVGNGGFSLRKIKSALLFFQSKRNVFSPQQLIRRIDIKRKPYTRTFVFFLMMLGWRNKPRVVAKRWQYNEDDFWSGLLDDSRFALKKPSPREALKFSFERFPSELYEMNNKQLSFGCHAWRKYQYNTFWMTFIK